MGLKGLEMTHFPLSILGLAMVRQGTFSDQTLIALLILAWNKGLELHTLRNRGMAHRFCGNATRLLQRLPDSPVKARYADTLSAGVSSFATTSDTEVR